MLSPERVDAFSKDKGGKNPQSMLQKRNFYSVMQDQLLENELHDVNRQVSKQVEEEKQKSRGEPNKRQRMDDGTSTSAHVSVKTHIKPSEWDKKEADQIKKTQAAV